MHLHTWLRLVHIVTGVIWTGSVVFLATMLVPAIRSTGPGGGTVMRELMQNRKMPLVLILLAWTALLSGVSLAWIDAGSLGFDWFKRGAGFVFGLGAVSAFSGAFVGMFVNAPTGKRLGALMTQIAAAQRPPSPEEAAQLARMQNTIFTATRLTAVLLVIATGLMAVARSFG